MELKKINILIVLPKLTCGGTERTAAELANHIAEQGGNVHLILMYKKEIFYDLHSHVTVIEPDIPRILKGKFLYLFHIILFLRSKIRELKPDVVFALGYILLTLISSIGINIKVIISHRSSPTRIRFPNNYLFNAIYTRSYWFLKKRVDGIIAQTLRAADVYKQRYHCPIVIIPNFLRELKVYNHKRQNLIINVGHCSFEKGQDYLIKAFAKLNAPGWKLIILGDGPRRKELELLSSELKVKDRITFAGYQKDVDYYLSQSKIFAFSSIIEGYPNALIEAMATPLPSVSFDCEAGPSDIIKDGENGFLVSVGDVETLASRLQQLIDDPNLRERIQNNALNIKYDNALSKIAPKYMEFFERIKINHN